MTTENVNKIREVLGEKWPKNHGEPLQHNGKEWWWAFGEVAVPIEENEAEALITLAMLEWAKDRDCLVERCSGEWQVNYKRGPSLFDLLVEVVTKENNQ